MYKNLIIDSNNLFWRSWFNNTTECVLGDTSIYNGGIELFIEKIKQLKKQFLYNEGKTYLLFDNPESTVKMRKLIDDAYKSHRLNNKYSKEINRSIQYLKEILRNYFDNTYIIYIDACEADDLVPLVLNLCKEKTLVISADLDWSRNIEKDSGKQIDWFNYKKVYDLEEFKNEFGFYPNGNRIKLYKSIRGDNSDNIQNAVPYLPEKILLHIIENFHDVPIEKLLNKILQDTTISQKWKIELKNCENDIRKNYTLVDFIDIDADIKEHMFECKKNKTLARVWFKIIGLNLSPWMIDTKTGVDFLSTKTFRKNKNARK